MVNIRLAKETEIIIKHFFLIDIVAPVHYIQIYNCFKMPVLLEYNSNIMTVISVQRGSDDSNTNIAYMIYESHIPLQISQIY